VHQWLAPVILATLEEETRRIVAQSHPLANSSQDPILKKPRAGRVPQVIQHLLSKHETLSSNPSITKKPPKQQKSQLKFLLPPSLDLLLQMTARPWDTNLFYIPSLGQGTPIQPLSKPELSTQPSFSESASQWQRLPASPHAPYHQFWP
jgi:hypothetical protein